MIRNIITGTGQKIKMNSYSLLMECQVDNKQAYKSSLEEIILCVMLNDPESINYISERIKSENFSNENREIFN